MGLPGEAWAAVRWPGGGLGELLPGAEGARLRDLRVLGLDADHGGRRQANAAGKRTHRRDGGGRISQKWPKRGQSFWGIDQLTCRPFRFFLFGQGQ